MDRSGETQGPGKQRRAYDNYFGWLSQMRGLPVSREEITQNAQAEAARRGTNSSESGDEDQASIELGCLYEKYLPPMDPGPLPLGLDPAHRFDVDAAAIARLPETDA